MCTQNPSMIYVSDLIDQLKELDQDLPIFVDLECLKPDDGEDGEDPTEAKLFYVDSIDTSYAKDEKCPSVDLYIKYIQG